MGNLWVLDLKGMLPELHEFAKEYYKEGVFHGVNGETGLESEVVVLNLLNFEDDDINEVLIDEMEMGDVIRRGKIKEELEILQSLSDSKKYELLKREEKPSVVEGIGGGKKRRKSKKRKSKKSKKRKSKKSKKKKRKYTKRRR